MKLATSFRLFALATVTLGICSLGCNTRTPIGDLFDAGDKNDLDASLGGAIGHGSGGAGGVIAGTGGVLGEGGASGGHVGGGGASGGSNSGGAGGSSGNLTACSSYPPPRGGSGGEPAGVCATVMYPPSGFYGDNVLASDCPPFKSGITYELDLQDLPAGATVVVTMTVLSLNGVDAGAGGAPAVTFREPGWFTGADGDWRTRGWDQSTQRQVFQTRPISGNETSILFEGTGKARIDITCDADTQLTATRTAIITWGP